MKMQTQIILKNDLEVEDLSTQIFFYVKTATNFDDVAYVVYLVVYLQKYV